MIVSPFIHIFDIISLFAAELEEPEIGISGKVINGFHCFHRDLEGDYDELPMDRRGSLSSMNSTATTGTSDSSSSGGSKVSVDTGTIIPYLFIP